jgi:pimeloyl-ACP methyl ester carboxylesterase
MSKNLSEAPWAAVGLERYHVVGISMGGGLLFSLLPAAGASIRSATMVNPTSPYGWSGSRDLAGTPCYDDWAGTGAGVWLPEVVQRMATKDRSSANPQTSPRVILSQCWKPPFRPAREEDLLSSILSTKIGPDKFPGDVVASPHWPGFAPGVWGASNATSPKYVGDTVERFVAASPKPPVLWVRGADDQVVADNSPAEIGTLGRLGIVPGWPGEDVYPPQPMVSQTRAVLERYQANGGAYREHVIADTGHAPMIEQPEAFMALLIEHLSAA